MYSTRIVVDIIECLNHRNAAVRAKAAIMCELGTQVYYIGAAAIFILFYFGTVYIILVLRSILGTRCRPLLISVRCFVLSFSYFIIIILRIKT